MFKETPAFNFSEMMGKPLGLLLPQASRLALDLIPSGRQRPLPHRCQARQLPGLPGMRGAQQALLALQAAWPLTEGRTVTDAQRARARSALSLRCSSVECLRGSRPPESRQTWLRSTRA